jgi:hypothetical protein
MTSGRGEWVRALFAANARDWTPPSVADAACALFAPISYDPEASRRWAAVLSHSEVQMAGRLVTEAARAQFEQRRAFQRYCAAVALGSRRPLSEIVFRQTAKGRAYLPDLPELWFSFSSCRRGFLGAWSWTLGVGVDLEDRTRLLDASAVAQHLFPEAEAKAVSSADGEERLRTFFQLWTLKVAAKGPSSRTLRHWPANSERARDVVQQPVFAGVTNPNTLPSGSLTTAIRSPSAVVVANRTTVPPFSWTLATAASTSRT